MQMETQVSLPKNTQIKPPAYKPPKVPLFIIFAMLFLCLSVIIAFFIFMSINIKNKSQNQLASTIIPTVLPATNTPVMTISPISISNPIIIYLREGNIWTVRSDGTNVRQITRDGNSNIKYSSLVFSDKNEIGFIRCETDKNKCSIKVLNLLSSEEKTILDEESLLSVFTRDKTGALIAYIKSSNNGISGLYFFEQNQKKKIFDFQPLLGRGGGLSDEISLSFSPDNRYLLVVNTGTQPNVVNDKKTIWVVDRAGHIIDYIEKELATDAVWETADRFLYKDGEFLFRKKITGKEESLASLPGYDFSPSFDGKSLIFWNKGENNQTNLIQFMTEDGSVRELRKDLSYPKWLDDKNIIAIKTIPNSESYMGFVTGGLVRYNLENKEEKILDSHPSIYQFIIQPE